MSWENRTSVGLVIWAVLEAIQTLLLRNGIRSRRMKAELYLSDATLLTALLPALLLVLLSWLGGTTVPSILYGLHPFFVAWQRWVLHAFAAMVLLVVNRARDAEREMCTQGQ